MEKRLDESRRIVRNSSQVAQEYLASLKGDAYVQYRKDWTYYGSNQIVPPNPLQINIEVTAACNLCCKMCFRNYPFHTRKGQLSLEEIEIIAQQAKELHIPSVWISGGEPTLHRSNSRHAWSSQTAGFLDGDKRHKLNRRGN